MYVRYDASKMVIQYNSRQETEMSGTSLPAGRGLRTGGFLSDSFFDCRKCDFKSKILS